MLPPLNARLYYTAAICRVLNLHMRNTELGDYVSVCNDYSLQKAHDAKLIVSQYISSGAKLKQLIDCEDGMRRRVTVLTHS